MCQANMPRSPMYVLLDSEIVFAHVGLTVVVGDGGQGPGGKCSTCASQKKDCSFVRNFKVCSRSFDLVRNLIDVVFKQDGPNG